MSRSAIDTGVEPRSLSEERDAQLLRDVRAARDRKPYRDQTATIIANRAITVERGCDGKVWYSTLEYAEKEAKTRGERFGHGLRPYFCMFCHKYHLSTSL